MRAALVGGPTAGRQWRWLLPAGLASAWLLLVALALLAPAFAHGNKLGDYPFAGQVGLGQVQGAVSHDPLTSDQILQTAPWAALNWTEVHAGHLPLWNPYSALGLPQLFDFQSAGLSLPMLVAYLLPLRFAYDVLVIVKYVIAGTGLLFAGRRALGLGWVAATFGATVGELSGSFSGWLGWPMTGTLCWLGWTLGACLLLLRDRHRLRWVVLLAVSLAFAAYGGHPESLVMLGLILVVTVAVVAVADVRRQGWRPTARSLVALAAGAAAGGALAAPLLVPGLLLLRHSVRNGGTGYVALGLHDTVGLALSGYYGYPTTGSAYFGNANYLETAAFVGVIALVLAVLGLVGRWRHRELVGLAVVCVVLLLIVYVGGVAHAINHVPLLKRIAWTRALIPLDLLLGLMAGIGLDCLLARRIDQRLVRGLAVIALVAGAVVAVLAARQSAHHLSAQAASIRRHGVDWAGAEAITALVVAAVLLIDQERRRGRAPGRRAPVLRYGGAAVLAAAETVFLLGGTPNLWSSSRTGFAPTPAETTLQQLAVGRRVGFASCVAVNYLPQLGIVPESNTAHGVAEMAMYDGLLPADYLTSYAQLTHTAPVAPQEGYFCPALTSATIARHYGVSLVLGLPGSSAPPGMVRDGTIGAEKLFTVPGSGIVTIEPVGAPADASTAQAIRTSDANPSVLHFATDATTASTLYLHIGNFAGWTATIDGHPLKLRTWASIELAATVPAGHHVITLRYRPRSFEVGAALALLAVLALLGAGGRGMHRGRRRAKAGNRTGNTAVPDERREAGLQPSSDPASVT